MKKIRLFSLLACAVMMLSICSCSKKETPVDQFVNALNALTEKAEKVTTMGEIMTLGPEMETANKIVYDNPDYVLTDKDKEALIKAMIKNTTVFCERMALISPNQNISDAEIDMLKTAISEQIKKADTLGDLIPAGAPTAEEAVEIVEDVELESPTDSINAEN